MTSPVAPRGQAGGPEEPIAVVGLSCRFPGDADSPDAFWDLLVQGRDGIGDGAERWAPYADTGHGHAAVVRETPTRGGFLADIAGFDAEFFGIAPREAELMDPQQRLLLELAWEALEHAGIPPLGLGGTDCGVFVGVGSDDYGRRLLEDLARIEPWTGIGAALCATANRISHSLDLRGPSLAVDTACSASLVGVHLACRSLLSGESDVALAAGVNLMVAPGLSVTLARAGATSPDGHSKPFDASADGYGRGEGAGVLVLKRLSDAERAGDRVLAVIRGSGVSQDGRTAGIMAPNGEAQADLLRRTYAQCGIAPETVDYVEAHGTGTVAGDPLEAGALAAVFGAGRPADSPCLIGSVKGNIGHLEAGSGIAGMIKTILALVHEEIPPSVHFSTPNPRIPWAESRLRVTQERTPWRRGERARRAGVSSFGYGGTIAHVVLEEAPAASQDVPAVPEEAPAVPADARTVLEGAPPAAQEVPARREPSAASEAVPAPPRLFPLSGRSGAAVREDAARLADWLDGPGAGVPLASLAQHLGTRRSHLDRRVAVVAADRAELEGGLRRFAAGDPAPGLADGTVTDEGLDKVVWVFSGTGAQWPGMGRELLATDTVFAEVIDRIGPVFAEEFGTTARDLIEDGDVTRVDVAQTMIYAVQMGLVAVWRSLGVRPAAVIGHSMGEIAAAATAGILSLEDGARLVCRRSVLLRRVAGAGGMLMIGLPADEAAARLGGTDAVVPAVLASPTTTVVAGAVAEIDALARELAADPSLLVRRVDSDVAFHSPQMEPLMKELAEAAADLTVHAPRIPVYSTALDDPRDAAVRDGAYWATNLRSPVRLSGAVAAAAEDGFRTFLEVSAHPVVRHSVQETLDTVGADRHCLAASLRRDTGEREHLLLNAGLLYCHGVSLDWPSAPGARPLSLPVRSWRRQRYWRDLPVHQADRGRHDPASRTLLGPRTTLAGTTPLDLWRTRVDLESRPYPGSHTIHGVEIVPAAVVLQTFLDAAGGSRGTGGLSDVSLELPLTLSTAQDVDVIAQDGVIRLLSRTADPKEPGPGDPGADGPDGDERSSPTHAVASVSGGASPPPFHRPRPDRGRRCPSTGSPRTSHRSACRAWPSPGAWTVWSGSRTGCARTSSRPTSRRPSRRHGPRCSTPRCPWRPSPSRTRRATGGGRRRPRVDHGRAPVPRPHRGVRRRQGLGGCADHGGGRTDRGRAGRSPVRGRRGRGAFGPARGTAVPDGLEAPSPRRLRRPPPAPVPGAGRRGRGADGGTAGHGRRARDPVPGGGGSGRSRRPARAGPRSRGRAPAAPDGPPGRGDRGRGPCRARGVAARVGGAAAGRVATRYGAALVTDPRCPRGGPAGGGGSGGPVGSRPGRRGRAPRTVGRHGRSRPTAHRGRPGRRAARGRREPGRGRRRRP
ncbi:type I polyketide synthase [Streptomyces sp. Tue 6430]|nr:type I polyketide synthase [Streptomyces sp. Tue 6430]